MDSLLADVRYAFRTLRRTPAFALAAVACLAIGIGANATMFGVVDALLFRPPAHVRDVGGVVRVATRRTLPGLGPARSTILTYPDLTDFREHATSLSSAAAFQARDVTLGRGNDAEQVKAVYASAALFPLLGVTPAVGRFYGNDEDVEGRDNVAVLDYGFWQRHFAGERSVIGRALYIAGNTYTVIGVAPKGFTGVDLAAVDMWLPISGAASGGFGGGRELFTMRNAYWVNIVGRLKPGITREKAAAELATLHAAAEAANTTEAPNGQRRILRMGGANDGPSTIELSSIIGITQGSDQREAANATVALWLSGVAAVVLLIACANVANLLLTRGMRRRREIAVRLALGIGRTRLVRQLLTETLVLVVTGGACGLLLAHWGGGVIRHFLLPNVAALDAVLDARVLLFTAAATLATGALCGLAPALQSSAPDLTVALKSGAREGSGFARSRLRGALLVGQIALTLVLLVGAGLFVRSLSNVRALDLGFDADKLLLVTLDLRTAGYTPKQSGDFFQRMQERVAALPGVERASTVVTVPFMSAIAIDLHIPGRDSLPQLRTGGPFYNPVTTEFFQTVGTPIVRGRGFTEADAAGIAHVAVVNQTMAKLYWPGEDALGKCIQIGGPRAPASGPPVEAPAARCTEIVGIAKDSRRHDLKDEEAAPQYYVPLDSTVGVPMRALYVRTRRDPSGLVTPVRRAVQELAPNLPFADVRPLETLLDPQLRPWRLGATMFGIFGAVALVLAVVGLYGVLAYSVAQRAQEIGVRIALGAQRGDVVKLVVGEGLRVAVIGVALGAAVALVTSRAIRSMLFGVSPADPVTLLVTALSLVAIAAAASYLPARRAARVDPAIALRGE